MTIQEKVPVLLIIFNRPDTTLAVIDSIKRYKPSQIYIASDGPRDYKEEEKAVVEQTRKLVLNNIDWDCEIKTLFREKNVGCGRGPSGAISWFFEHVEMGIILEDDCVPDEKFFVFCAEMLKKYKSDKTIMQINGSNPFGEKSSNLYLKTIHERIWGWATWADRWQKYSYSMRQWDEYLTNKKLFLNRYYWLEGKIYDTYWKMMKKELQEQTETAWDTQWAFCIVMNHGFCLQPNVNLIQNIGFDSGTHFSGPTNSTFKTVDYGTMTLPFQFSEKTGKDHDRKEALDFMRKKVVAFIRKSLKVNAS